MKIAITGASGHIGAAVCRELLKDGHELVVLIRKSSKSLEGMNLSIVEGDVQDKESLRQLMEDAEVVIHVAGVIELGYSFNQRLYDVNYTGTKNVLEVAKEKGVGRVIAFSSIHVFCQKPYHEPLDESREFIGDKSIFYDRVKRDSHLLAVKAHEEGQDVVILCPTGVIGPWDYQPSKLGKAIMDIYNEKFPAIIKGGFDFVDVRDIAKGTKLAIEKGVSGEAYILGGEYHTLKQLNEMIYKIKQKKKKVVELPVFFAYLGVPFIQLYSFFTRKKPLYDKVYLDILCDGNQKINCSKAENVLGYTKTPLFTTLTDTIDWFIENEK